MTYSALDLLTFHLLFQRNLPLCHSLQEKSASHFLLSVKYVSEKMLKNIMSPIWKPQRPEITWNGRVTSSSKNSSCKQNFGTTVPMQYLATHVVFLPWWRKHVTMSHSFLHHLAWASKPLPIVLKNPACCHRSHQFLQTQGFDLLGFKGIFIKQWKQNIILWYSLLK